MLTKVRAFSIFKDSDIEDLCSGDDVDSMTKEIFLTFFFFLFVNYPNTFLC